MRASLILSAQPVVRGYASKLVRETLRTHGALTTAELWDHVKSTDDFESPLPSKRHMKKNILNGFMKKRELIKTRPANIGTEEKTRVGKNYLWMLTEKGENFEGAELPDTIEALLARRLQGETIAAD